MVLTYCVCVVLNGLMLLEEKLSVRLIGGPFSGKRMELDEAIDRLVIPLGQAAVAQMNDGMAESPVRCARYARHISVDGSVSYRYVMPS